MKRSHVLGIIAVNTCLNGIEGAHLTSASLAGAQEVGPHLEIVRRAAYAQTR